MGREDEIGAIAHALAQARESERLAELSRRERQRAEEALRRREQEEARAVQLRAHQLDPHFTRFDVVLSQLVAALAAASTTRSEKNTSDLQSRMRISYAVICLLKKISIMLIFFMILIPDI